MKIKTCEYCGKEFVPKSNRQRYCSGPHYMKCPICGVEYEVANTEKLKFPPTACSYACRAAKTAATSMERYGCKAPGNNPQAREKAKSTMESNLGVPYALMSEEVRAKAKETLLERYGVDNANKNAEISKKRVETDKKNHGGILAFNTPESYAHKRETMLERYGGEGYASAEICEKIKQTMLDTYGAEYMMQVPELKLKQQNSVFKHYGVTSAFSSPEVRERCKQTMYAKYGVENAAHSEALMKKSEQSMLEKYGRAGRISKINEEFAALLDKHGISYTMEKFITTGTQSRWFDFCLEDKKIVIEINPTYTHTPVGNHWGAGVPKDYHFAKTRLAEEFGYRCIHVFSWDTWDDIIKMLTPRKSIYARKCEIRQISKKEADEFIDNNHIQGKCRGSDVALAAIYENEIYQVMTFGRSRYDKKHSTELLRLCTKSGYQVIGGASKLFKYATRTLGIHDIISYCDRSKFTGRVYEQLGMKLIRTTSPQEVWSKGNQKITANLLRQRGFDQLFDTSFGKGTSNELLMLEHGWLPVYDCGQEVYSFR